MGRLTETLLLLAPLVAALLWFRPHRNVTLLASAWLAVTVAGLMWLALDDHLGAHDRYIPAQWEDGRIVPGHAAP